VSTTTDILPAAHFIGGEWSPASSGKTSGSIDPATEEIHAELAAGDATDVDRAVQAARESFDSGIWRNMPPSKRSRILWKMADLIDQNRAAIAHAETMDTGKTAFDSGKIEVPLVAEIFRYYAGWVTKLEGSVLPLPGDSLGLSLREPVGVCGMITPWNFPMLLAAWKVAPALACGNSIVLKPSEQTSFSSMWMAKLAAEAGVPAGVFNVVTGGGRAVGTPLVQHPGVDKISFTGSTEVGRMVQREASNTLKRVTLELGGKSPNIVFNDADLKAAVRGAATGIFYNKGEVCAAGSRVLVQRGVYEEFLAGIEKMAGKTTVGHPLAEGTRMGPVCNADQFKSVLEFIEKGKAEGARLLAGGQSLQDEVGNGKGYYIAATVFADVDPKATIAQEEIFGPVVSATTFKDEAEALKIANDTLYGLGAGVWTRDGTRAYRFGRNIKAGRVWTNCYHLYPAHAAFGGYKQSGIGRENHKMMLNHYQQTKNLLVSYDPKPMGFF
jgi:acyl-CoA reductase-like NAD-dependent aldehyde dehydrogenase